MQSYKPHPKHAERKREDGLVEGYMQLMKLELTSFPVFCSFISRQLQTVTYTFDSFATYTMKKQNVGEVGRANGSGWSGNG